MCLLAPLLLIAPTLPIQLGVATFTVGVQARSMYPYPFGIMDRKQLSLLLPDALSLQAHIVSAEGSTGSFALRTGEIGLAKKVEVALAVTKPMYYYPFDEYEAQIV